MDISFVIPAFNEEKYISICLKSIQEYCNEFQYEIIVVDNGSTDNTAQIAKSLGAIIISSPDGTIGSLRNKGAAKATGRTLIFLDGDVELTEQWISEYKKVSIHVKNAALLTGSQVATPTPPTLIERYWFEEFYLRQDVSHIGSAHLILSSETFSLIGGFDESLETGEDYEFCQRAKLKGTTIVNNIQLRVIHHGFPKTIGGFIKRESWHGKSDFVSISSILESKVAIASILFLSAHVALFCSILTNSTTLLVLSSLAILGLLVVSVLSKYSHSKFKAQIINIGIFYFYYVGRTFSAIRSIFDRITSSNS